MYFLKYAYYYIERKKTLPCGRAFVHRTSTISLIPYFNKKKLSCTKSFRLFISAAWNTEKRIREGIHFIIFEVNAKRGVDRQFFHVCQCMFSFRLQG
jgi:hypothetical protein